MAGIPAASPPEHERSLSAFDLAARPVVSLSCLHSRLYIGLRQTGRYSLQRQIIRAADVDSRTQLEHQSREL